MNLTNEYLKQIADVAKAYDAEKDTAKRVKLGEKLDGLTRLCLMLR